MKSAKADELPSIRSGAAAGPGFARSILYTKLVLTAVFWGGTFVAARIVAQESGLFSAAFLRFAVASLFLLAYAVRCRGKIVLPEPRHLFLLTMLGLTGVFAYNVFFFSGLKTIAAGRASLIIAANPVFIALFSAAFFKEKLGPIKTLGIAISVAGAATVVAKGNPMAIFRGNIGLGELYIVGCVASWVAYSLIGKVAMKDLSPLLAVTYACIIGAFGLFFPALGEGMAGSVAHYSIAAWMGIFYLGFLGSALGFVWYYEGIRAVGPSRAGVFINLVPLSSVILAYLILHETLDVSMLIGALLVILGVYLTNRS